MLQKIWLSIAALLLCMPAAWAQQKNIIKTVAKTAARDVKAAETGSAVKHLTAATQGTAHRAAKASASNAAKLSAHHPADKKAAAATHKAGAKTPARHQKAAAPATQTGAQAGTKKSPKHSVYPSANLAFVKSEAVPEKVTIVKENTLSDKAIIGRERQRWVNLRNELAELNTVKPTQPGQFSQYMRHDVPAETMEYLTKQYAEVQQKIAQAKADVMPTIYYNALPGEGRMPVPAEVGWLVKRADDTLYAVRAALTSIPKDPYLLAQETYWVRVIEELNPMLKGKLGIKKEVAGRIDRRHLDLKEFFLKNPDGTDYLLPRSSTLILDPDELEEMESYAYVRMKKANPPITQEAAAIEREELLKHIPENMRIAVINDDTLPRLNFSKWGEKGYLGKNAKVEVFADGSKFLQNVQDGVHYDLVVTDLLVPNGGLAMMPELRQMDQNVAVIASSKYDRGEEPADGLFAAGMDGYLWYNTNLNEGAYGYIEYLRAMKNYFHYKKQYGWQR